MYQRSNGRQSFSFRQLFWYIRKDKGRAAEIPQVAIYHNIPFEPEAIIKAFEENDRYRRSNPRCTTTQFHDYVSFHPDDTKHLTPEKLRIIMQEYIRIRTDNRALVYAQAHLHSNAIHAHFQISGTEAGGPKAMSKRKPEYKKMRRALEDFQRERFPELEKSIVLDRDGDRIRPRQTERERQMQRRTKKPSQKMQLAQIVKQLFKKARNEAQFYSLIRAKGIPLYIRVVRGVKRIQGVKTSGGAKVRFTTLGITKQMMVELAEREKAGQIQERKQQLGRVLERQELERDQERNRGRERKRRRDGPSGPKFGL